MATYINNYGGMESTNTSCYGVTGCKWKPRKLSAKRDFPKAFGEVAMNHTKLSKVEPPALLDVPQNISDDGHDDVSRFPKKRKVSAVKELSKVTAGDYIENVAPVESEEGFTNTGKFDLSNESTDIVRDDYSKDELVTSDSVSLESSSSTDMRGSDYDMRPHATVEHEDTYVVELINTDKVTHYAKRKVSAIRCFPPGCGRNAFAQKESYGEAESDNYLKDESVPFELDSVSVKRSSSTEMRGSDYDIEHEDTDVIELINTDKETQYVKRKVSAIRCFPPGCGRNTYAEEKRQYQTDGQMKVQVIVANLHNNGIDVEPAREENGTHKSASYRMMDEERNPREQLRPCRPRVWAVRCFPPGCGPDAENLTEEDVKVALAESRKGMLTRKSCRTK
nr:hypothetical protein [Tanacetum cinerariifolium]